MSTLKQLIDELAEDKAEFACSWGDKNVYYAYFSDGAERRTGYPQYILEEAGDFRFATDEEMHYIMRNGESLLKGSDKLKK